MTADELTNVDGWLEAAQSALPPNAEEGKVDGVRRLILALRADVALLLEAVTLAPAAAHAVAPESGADSLLRISHALESAMDTVRSSRDHRSTAATKLYASLTALLAEVTFVRGERPLPAPAARAAPRSPVGTPAAGRGLSFAGIPNLARNGWRDIRKAEHYLQIHESDEALLRAASEFVADGLWRAERVIVIAPEPHRDDLARRLRSMGVDVVSAIVRRKYLARDADELLERVMAADEPDRSAFEEVLAGIAANGGSRIETRMFSEMGTRLWQRGNRAGALKLEQWWTELGARRGISVFCGYPTACFTAGEENGALADLCRLHERVVPPEDQPSPRLSVAQSQL